MIKFKLIDSFDALDFLSSQDLDNKLSKREVDGSVDFDAEPGFDEDSSVFDTPLFTVKPAVTPTKISLTNPRQFHAQNQTQNLRPPPTMSHAHHHASIVFVRSRFTWTLNSSKTTVIPTFKKLTV